MRIMRLKGYITLLLLISCLSSTVSFGQEDTIKKPISDLEILAEGCIRQTHLEEDTTVLNFQVRYCEEINAIYENQIANLVKQRDNSDNANKMLEYGLKDCKVDLKQTKRKIRWQKLGLATLPPLALIGGILLGAKFGN